MPRFPSHFLPGSALVLALCSLGPATAASPDCPKAHSTFAADNVWGLNAPSQSAKSLRILAIGSSSTQGIGASAPGFAYPAQLQTRLTTLLGRSVEVVNAGIGGETIATTLVRLKAALTTSKPDLVIWQVGTNDAVIGEDEASFRASLLEGVSAIRAAKIPFVLLDPQFYPGLKDASHYEHYVRIIDDAGQHSGAAVFARYAMMKAWEAESDALLRAMLSKDAFHMSDRGYGCLAESLAADLAPRLRQLSTQAIGSSGTPSSIVK